MCGRLPDSTLNTLSITPPPYSPVLFIPILYPLILPLTLSSTLRSPLPPIPKSQIFPSLSPLLSLFSPKKPYKPNNSLRPPPPRLFPRTCADLCIKANSYNISAVFRGRCCPSPLTVSDGVTGRRGDGGKGRCRGLERWRDGWRVAVE
ncbi:hypothetical protein E2C01_099684 [Portunus trituberculatus]|uniref:Uncharacterized protein n=1 Tax=Portunus trituberculatus TaxID=210409 RepID=A0A5B7KB26_PORTR|nr:hypothetical protein [Portunus trituberculatus]